VAHRSSCVTLHRMRHVLLSCCDFPCVVDVAFEMLAALDMLHKFSQKCWSHK
jgi:hypothetical protein